MVKRRGYIPERGDIIWFDFSPTKGHEQSGRRPALVLTPQNYNQLLGLALVCPITSKQKGYSFEIQLTRSSIKGVILSDQLRNIDWRARKVVFAERTEESVVLQALENLRVLLLG